MKYNHVRRERVGNEGEEIRTRKLGEKDSIIVVTKEAK